MEATVAPAVTPLSPHWIGVFEKPFLPDLEEDLDLGKVEWGHSRRGSLHERPKEERRPDPNHECLDDQGRVCIGDGPDVFYEMDKVWAEGLIFHLSYPKERCGGWL
ncbi:hypothetical protein B296_00000359 [Ensete ventricosum]|uniref:Uncharacterized protein n=1 Tax=Ensete ventricosum TaxID=4639 RepID=A0A426ZRQ3_ENSVE|nr:hypothetical protein B296_00000359 [Ensete ventricosum]